MIRFFDICFSFIGLMLLSPILLLIAIWIKLDSHGPVFFRQTRVGRLGVDFLLIKFRTMRMGSEQKGLLTVGGNDPRVTRPGLFIRKYKLDELPQLVNVLTNHMSLVGPRPEVRKYVELYTPEQQKVLSVKPGITDLASIHYANENQILEQYPNPEKAYIEIIMPHKIKLNMDYIANYSVKRYFQIIFLTFRKIVA